jgi:sRNA-binding protein
MKHIATTTYRATREDNENIIRMLLENYPACFFNDPRQRRPLKKNIAADVIADKILQVADEAIIAAITWYQSNIGYEGFAMSVAGAKRINLKGIEVGTVTQSEALEAQQRLDDYHAKKNAEQNNPVRVLSNMHADGRVTDCGVRKVDAPTIAPARTTKAAAIAPEFAALYETLSIANATVNGISDPAMRAMRLTVAKATLGEVINKAEQTKQELNKAKE